LGDDLLPFLCPACRAPNILEPTASEFTCVECGREWYFVSCSQCGHAGPPVQLDEIWTCKDCGTVQRLPSADGPPTGKRFRWPPWYATQRGQLAIGIGLIVGGPLAFYTGFGLLSSIASVAVGVMFLADGLRGWRR
jgi:hypothetical protein